MRTLAALLLLTAAGCGALFADDTTTVSVSAPAGARVELDGMPSHAGQIVVSNHAEHTITATLDGKVIGGCHIGTHDVTRYVVGDVLLFETIAPLVIDVATHDWDVLDATNCHISQR